MAGSGSGEAETANGAALHGAADGHGKLTAAQKNRLKQKQRKQAKKSERCGG